MTRIDMHAHVIPDDYRALLETHDAGRTVLPPAQLSGLTEMMERYEIDAAVISTGPPGAYLADQAIGAQLARVANEAIADIVRSAPSTFGGLALLPLPDLEAALDELTYALDVLELDGVMLLSNVGGAYLGDGRWEPLYDELARRSAYVFVHPTLPPYGLPLGAYYPAWLYEFPFDTTRVLNHLIYTGTLKRHPAIRMQFAHLGGATPFLAHRLASLAERDPGRAAGAGLDSAVEYLNLQYYDTGLSANPPAIAATLAVTALDHVVFGTDWPYAELPVSGNDPAPGLGCLGSPARSAVDGRHAAALVPRLTEQLLVDSRA
jgi:predicted TIM-barrel fold metal-dependent hydrolase